MKKDGTCQKDRKLSPVFRAKKVSTGKVGGKDPQTMGVSPSVILGNLPSQRASSWALEGFKDGCGHSAIVPAHRHWHKCIHIPEKNVLYVRMPVV